MTPNPIPITMNQRCVFIPHDGFARMPVRTRVSHRPTTQIQELVAVSYGLHPNHMVSQERTRHVAWPRMIAMYLTRKITKRSTPAIAEAFQKKDHTTVLHAIRRVEKQMETDAELRAEIEALVGALTR